MPMSKTIPDPPAHAPDLYLRPLLRLAALLDLNDVLMDFLPQQGDLLGLAGERNTP
jgi:hypothetical protein